MNVLRPTVASPTFRFDPGDLVRLGGADYVYVRPCDAGHVMRRHAGVLEETFTHADAARFAARADFLHSRGHYSEEGGFARQRAGVTSLNELPPAERSRVMWKLHWCDTFLAMEAAGAATRSDASMTTAIGAIRAKSLALDCARIERDERGRKKRAGTPTLVRAPPCPRTLRTWLSDYQKGGCRPHVLRDGYRHCGNRTLRLEPEIYGYLKETAQEYCSEKRPGVPRLHRGLQIKLEAVNAERASRSEPKLDLPSIRVLRKAVKQLPAFEVYASRHGVQTARKRFAIVKETIEVTRPGERVETDEWTAHVQTLFIKAGIWRKLSSAMRRDCVKRLVVNFVFDCATRCVLGVSIGETATGAMAKAAMRMAVSDKGATAAAAGAATPWDMRLTPENVVNDGGSGLISEEAVAALRDLLSGAQVPPGEHPEKRPYVERFHRSVDECFLPNFTGRTFTNVEDRGDYDAQARASLTVDAFCITLVRWIVDVYHNAPHTGLGGETPRNAWLRLTDLYSIIPPPAADRRRAIFGTELSRKVTLRGVRVLGLHYLDRELAEEVLARGLAEVTIRVDQDDLSAVSLRIGESWRRLPCRSEGLEGVSIIVWTKAAADLRRRYKDQARIPRDVVLAAIASIKAIARDCEAAVGITRTNPTEVEIERIEREVLFGLEVPSYEVDDDASAEGDAFGRALATGGSRPPPAAPPPVEAVDADERAPGKRKGLMTTARSATAPAPAPSTKPKIWIEE